jgi:UDP-N-acetylmuramoylalanine--D-glutamate ligase
MNGRYVQNTGFSNGPLAINIYDEYCGTGIYGFMPCAYRPLYYTMAAGIMPAVPGIRKQKVREAVKTFQSHEHRMEYVGAVRGVEFINDSKATNINSTWFTLENTHKPAILILGGTEIGNNYTVLESLVKEKVKVIVCMGINTLKIRTAFERQVSCIVNVYSVFDAVNTAFGLANKGDVVLFSPACPSFDLFNNCEDRGMQFKKAVKLL